MKAAPSFAILAAPERCAGPPSARTWHLSLGNRGGP
jgi:hypothetical protein